MADLDNFIALDLETANVNRGSICEVGIAVFNNGDFKYAKKWLVQPEGNRYNAGNIFIHGITPEMTSEEPSFPVIWEEIKDFFDGSFFVVAHHTPFDMYSLADCLSFYGIPFPKFEYLCTVRCSRHAFPGLDNYSLPTVCAHLGIDLNNHHRAMDDAKACGMIFAKVIDHFNLNDSNDLAQIMNSYKGRFDENGHSPQRAVKDDSGRVYDPLSYLTDPDEATLEQYKGNYFTGKSVCFTGTFSLAPRRDLLQAIADVGGIPTNSVTAKTDILIVGQQDFRVVGEEGMSSKQKKALSMQEKGLPIEILSEKDFLAKFGSKLLGQRIETSMSKRVVY